MSNKFKRKKKAGLPPGTVIFTGDRKVEEVGIHYLHYNSKELKEEELTSHGLVPFHKAQFELMQWYDVRGLHDTALIERLGQLYVIHPLVLEDIASTTQRPKFEEYENGVFIKLKSLEFDKLSREVVTEEVAIYFGKNYLLTFQERAEDLFISIRERINAGRGRIRAGGADYLAYALLDNIVDNYFGVIEGIQDEIELLEYEISNNPAQNSKSKILSLKKEVLKVRKAIVPLREALSQFAKSNSSFIKNETGIYLRDVYDHTIQIVDMTDSSRDLLSGLQDLYITEISFKMNKVMQVLTIVTVVFVPITFLAGIYGMNFDNIPELHSPNGYYYLLGTMLCIVLFLLFLFKRKNWL